MGFRVGLLTPTNMRLSINLKNWYNIDLFHL
jgi:hypothetical protein